MQTSYDRRHFLRHAATGAAACYLSPRLLAQDAEASATHPRIYLSASGPNGLRTPDDLRAAIKGDAWAKATWQRILERATREAGAPPILPDAVLPGRPAAAIRDRNPDFVLCEETGARLVRFALVTLLTGDAACKRAALEQCAALFDPTRWPDWIDQAHLSMGHPAGLRTGMLAKEVAIAYDWMWPSLDDAERTFLREGLNRRGIQPILTSIAQDAWWAHDLNNWTTVIYGGLGIAGMVLRGEHPDADRSVALALQAFERYLTIYGPEGEFNESVAYAGANRMPVSFFLAHFYATGGRDRRLAEPPFPQMARWVMQTTLTGRRTVPFGDCHPENPVTAGYLSAIAAANRDGVLQQFTLTHQEETTNAYDLLWYDPRVHPVEPNGHEPLAVAYRHHGGVIVSRTSWDFDAAACIVFGKSGREENHEHNDVGQLGFNALGERLIIDIGSPSAYPTDFFEPDTRWRYYNASVRSHNVLMFGGREQRTPTRARGEPIDVSALSGELIDWWHEPDHGAAWRLDLTPAYTGVRRVTRTVLHLWPGYIAVLDEAELLAEEEISLRWHPIDRPVPDNHGRFVVHGQRAAANALVIDLNGGPLPLQRREHAYVAPFDRERTGDPLEQRHESYIEAVQTATRCRWLTLFATGARADFGASGSWQAGSATATWRFETAGETIEARVTATDFSLATADRKRSVRLPLGA